MGTMHNRFEIEEMLSLGEYLILAGDESVLDDIPAGNWIGGTIPYFMTEVGGQFNKDRAFVTRLPSFVKDIEMKVYGPEEIQNVFLDAPSNGFSIIVIPAFSVIHFSFALNSPTYSGFANSPIVGWVSGGPLNGTGQLKPKTYAGATKKSYFDEAVVFHIGLPKEKVADIQIINVFEQSDGDVISFPDNGFEASVAKINGKEVDFPKYIANKAIDTRLPLVANMCGVMINTSFREVDLENNKVSFYAPVFEGVKYKLAHPVRDYVNDFKNKVPSDVARLSCFSCNCILNYIHADLEGKSLHGMTGPMTFGEIAYQLLNQTMVCLTIEDA